MIDSAPNDAPQAEWVGDVPLVRLPDTYRVFEDAVDFVTAAIRASVKEGHPHLLLDVCAAAFPSPSLAERLRMVRGWAEAADGRVRVAMVALPSFIDPERFGVIAAGNFGLIGQVFMQQADAIAWLREERAAELRRAEAG